MNTDHEEDFIGQNINIDLPVNIPYRVIDKFLKEKLIGEFIKKENSDGKITRYAQILGIALAEDTQGYDLSLDIQMQTLTSIFRNKKIDLDFLLNLQLDSEEQDIFVSDYKVVGKTSNWLADKFIQTLLNNWMYGKMKNRMSFDFRPVIREQLEDINDKLSGDMEPAEGVFVSGALDDLAIVKLSFRENSLQFLVSLKGNTALTIKKIRMN